MPRSDQPFDPNTFDFGPPRQLGPLAGVRGDSLFGYYQLERSEQFATFEARERHPEYLDAWYRLLDGYYRSLPLPQRAPRAWASRAVGHDLENPPLGTQRLQGRIGRNFGRVLRWRVRRHSPDG